MHAVIKLTLVLLQLSVFHIGLGVFLLELQPGLFIPAFFLEILGLGLDRFERRESEERRWLRRHRSLPLQLLWHLPRRRRRRRWRQSRLQALLGAVGEAVVVVVVVVMVLAVLVAVQDMFTCAEVVGFRILLQLMRLVAPVLGVLVVMELHFLRLLLRPFVGRRRQIPFLLLFPLFNEPIQTLPQPFFLYFRTEQVHLSCHLCTYSTFKGLEIPTAQVPPKL